MLVLGFSFEAIRPVHLFSFMIASIDEHSIRV